MVTAQQRPVCEESVPVSPVGRDHGYIIGLLLSWLVPFVKKNKLGWFGTDRGFILAHDSDVVRAPDAFSLERHRERAGKGLGVHDGAPDLAVEVLSPFDTASDVQVMLREYMTVGTRLVWVVDPHGETLSAYHPSGSGRVYSRDQEVTGEDVLPGFSFRCRDLFEIE